MRNVARTYAMSPSPCYRYLVDSATGTLGASFEMTSFLLLKKSKAELVQGVPEGTTPLVLLHVTPALLATARALTTPG